MVLVDPYLTRFKTDSPNGQMRPDDPRASVKRDEIVAPDRAVIDAHVKRADFILVTHTHSDHVFDAPYIAQKTGAMVIGKESTINYARASGVPASQLFTVRGGEDLEFGVFSVRVVPSLHGILRRAPNVQGAAGPLPPLIFPADAKTTIPYS